MAIKLCESQVGPASVNTLRTEEQAIALIEYCQVAGDAGLVHLLIDTFKPNNKNQICSC